MASHRFVILSIAMIVVIPTIAMAAEYIVGDEKGWNVGFDFEAWAKSKMFNVGDTLVFKYNASKHDVTSVDGPAFKNCSAPADAKRWTSGNDTVSLDNAGNKWYLCSKADHCANGLKLKISVMNMSAPQPSPSFAARGFFFSRLFQLFMAAFVLFMAFN